MSCDCTAFRSRAIPFLAAMTCCLAACGGDGQIAEFVEACTDSTSMGTEICECMAELANEELSEDGFAFVLASMQGNADQAQAMVGGMQVEEATQAGLFMVTAPANCVSQQ